MSLIILQLNDNTDITQIYFNIFYIIFLHFLNIYFIVIHFFTFILFKFRNNA